MMSRLQVKACALCGAVLCFKVPGQSLCIMWCCIVFQSRADKIYALLQVIGCSNLSITDFMRWMHNCQGFMWF
jgi:hypothetical protein